MTGADQTAASVLHAAAADPPRPVTVEMIRRRVTRRRHRGALAGAGMLAVAVAVGALLPGMLAPPGGVAARWPQEFGLTGAAPLTHPEAVSAQQTLTERLRFLGIQGSVAVADGHLTVRAPVPTRLLPALTRPGEVQFRQVLSVQSLAGGTQCPPPAAAFTACDRQGQSLYRLGPVIMTSADLARVRTARTAGGTGSWEVELVFNATGDRLMAAATGPIAASKPPADEIAICIDGVVWSAPTLAGPLTGPQAQITGDFTKAQATLLAASITGRPLPQRLHTLALP